MNKTKCLFPIPFILIVTSLAFTVLILIHNEEKWDHWSEFATKNGHYTVILNRSEDALAMGKMYRFQIVCRHNLSGREKMYTEIQFSVPKDDKVKWFQFQELDSNKAELIINSSHGKDFIEFVWTEVFV